jgi:hypothetical protein
MEALSREAIAAALALLVAPLASCHAAGPYGHAKVYAPTADEERAVDGNEEYDALLAERAVDRLKGRKAWAFGVVTSRGSGPDGSAYVALSLRSLQARNVCKSTDESSCRVTVGEREMARVHALMALAAEDDMGQDSVGLGSLLRIVGTVSQDLDPSDGTPVLRATFYRHWPRGSYATTKAANIPRH